MNTSFARIIHLLVTDKAFRSELAADMDVALARRGFDVTGENRAALRVGLAEFETREETPTDSTELVGWDVGSSYTRAAFNEA